MQAPASSITPPPNLCRHHVAALPAVTEISASRTPFLKRDVSRRRSRSLLLLHANPSKSPWDWDVGGIDLRNIERALKLQKAVSNRSVKELVALLVDECRYCCASLPFHPLHLSKKALEMMYDLMVRNNVMLVIKPTEARRLDIGVRWVSSEAEEFMSFYVAGFAKDKIPLGFGCTITTTHLYEGCVFFSNAKNLIHAMIQMQLAQKLEKMLLPVIDKLVPKGVLEGKERTALIYTLLSLFIMAVSLFLFKNALL